MGTEIDELRTRLGEEWPNIMAARSRTQELLEKTRERLAEFESADSSIVVFGSLGRGEAGDDSDVDWILLVDGQAAPGHLRMVTEVAEIFDELGLGKPGRTDTFGAMANSHDLVQHIAGIRDSNRNLTLRMLLLLESKPLTMQVVRKRVIQNILERYIVHDTAVPRAKPPEDIIPHFLLNDVVRYWRTMASDYAAKMFERRAEGWATRNLKLRFSRKLIFIAGLLASLSFELFPRADRSEVVDDPEKRVRALVDHVADALNRTPLDGVARLFLARERPELAREFLGSYDQFLGVLTDDEKRKHLEGLKPEEALSDEVWQDGYQASRRFRRAVRELFFGEDERLKELMLEYGVF